MEWPMLQDACTKAFCGFSPRTIAGYEHASAGGGKATTKDGLPIHLVGLIPQRSSDLLGEEHAAEEVEHDHTEE